MTHLQAHDGAVMHAANAETLIGPTSELQLLLDSSATGGALSAHRVRLRSGAEGANPHRHSRSSEMFYVLDGQVDVLVGAEVITATAGDLVVVPPDTPHAFAASPDLDGELLVVITPGIERFEFFRGVHRMITGQTSSLSLSNTRDRFDNHPAHSPAWDALRRGPAHRGSTT